MSVEKAACSCPHALTIPRSMGQTRRSGGLLNSPGLDLYVDPKVDAKLEGDAGKTHGGDENVQAEPAAKKRAQSADAPRRMAVNVSRRRRESLWN